MICAPGCPRTIARGDVFRINRTVTSVSCPGIGISESILPERTAPAGPALNRKVHPITPVILDAYYLAGEIYPVNWYALSKTTIVSIIC